MNRKLLPPSNPPAASPVCETVMAGGLMTCQAAGWTRGDYSPEQREMSGGLPPADPHRGTRATTDI